MGNKSGALIAALALGGFGLFLLTRGKKEGTRSIPPGQGGGLNREGTFDKAAIVDVLGLPAKTVKFFEQATTKAGLSAGLTPAQIFSLGRTGKVNVTNAPKSQFVIDPSRLPR